jgi:hypothetical protein
MVSHEFTSNNIDLYLNPTYWDGHSLGLGEINDAYPVIRKVEDDEYAFTEKIVNGLPNKEFSVTQIYTSGDVFDVHEYEPGSLVVLRNEMLVGEPIEDLRRFSQLKEQPLPDRPSGMVTGPNDLGSGVFAHEGTTNYISVIRYGLVLAEVADALCVIDAEPGIERRALSMRIRSPISVGETMHEHLEEDGEIILRVNTIHAINRGISHRRKLSKWLNGLGQ